MTSFTNQGLWLRLLKLGATEDPLSSFEYGTILGKYLWYMCLILYVGDLDDCWWINMCTFAALIESDADGIGGSGFVECIREHIHTVCLVVKYFIRLYRHHMQNYLYFIFSFFHSGVDLSIDRRTVYCCQRIGTISL